MNEAEYKAVCALGHIGYHRLRFPGLPPRCLHVYCRVCTLLAPAFKMGARA